MWNERWKKLSAAQRLAIVASAAAGAVWAAVWVAPSADVAETAPAATAVPPLESAPAPASASAQNPQRQPPPERSQASLDRDRERESHTARAPRADQQPAAAAKPSNENALAAFREAMASDNSETRIAALLQLDKDGTLEALPELLESDLTHDPEVAPTLIQVSAQLAQRSPLRERGVAAEQMSSWLKAESAREGDDARSNVSMLVESLSGLHSPKTQSALLEVLQNDKLPLHLQTLAVDGLSHFPNPETKAALTQFREQLDQGTREGFELELQHEAQQATDKALARVSR
jgi:hypothetical protein